MGNFSWHDYLVIVSVVASIAGIALLVTDQNVAKDHVEAADRLLILMTFVYWLVYCAAVLVKPLILPEWEVALLSIKLTGVIAYLLTASCVLSLPLNRVSGRQLEE